MRVLHERTYHFLDHSNAESLEQSLGSQAAPTGYVKARAMSFFAAIVLRSPGDYKEMIDTVRKTYHSVLVENKEVLCARLGNVEDLWVWSASRSEGKRLEVGWVSNTDFEDIC